MSEEKNIERPQTTDDRLPATDDRPPGQTTPDENVVPESSSDSQPSALDLKPSTLNLQPPDMETHAHHLHKSPGHGWKHYFFEFFMLFLAVSLGFFVENQREHYVEKQREKEFAKALYTEFLNDSTEAANKVAMRQKKEKDMDYLYGFIKDSALTNLPKDFYPAFTTSFYLINSYAFEPKDGILNQVKNSGSLRYFKNIELQKLLGDISVCINNMRYRNEQEYQFFASPLKLFLLKHYDFNWLNKLRQDDGSSYLVDVVNNYRKGDRVVEGNILNLSSFDRGEACNMIAFYKQMLISTKTLQLINYVKTNHKILAVLRENYAVKNE